MLIEKQVVNLNYIRNFSHHVFIFSKKTYKSRIIGKSLYKIKEHLTLIFCLTGISAGGHPLGEKGAFPITSSVSLGVEDGGQCC